MRAASSGPLGGVSAQVLHQSGSPGESGPLVSRRVSAQPAGARDDVADRPDAPDTSMADKRPAVMVRFSRAGSAPGGGGAPERIGPGDPPTGLRGRPQPWPMAMPSGLVTVMQMRLCGLAAASSARSRHRSGSRGPSPCASPGRSARSSSVASGTVRSASAGRPPGRLWSGDAVCWLSAPTSASSSARLVFSESASSDSPPGASAAEGPPPSFR